MRRAARSLRKAFTLIELSIVLVIIGLLVGGVLAGRLLIQAAEARAQVAQIEQYRGAAATFREKYGYLPGDITAAPALQFGLAARGTFKGQGDGNGLLQRRQGGGATDFPGLEGEQGLFWRDLSQMGLIEGGFTAASATTAPSPPLPAGGTLLARYVPLAKLGRNNTVSVFSGGWRMVQGSHDGKNYLLVSAQFFSIYGLVQNTSIPPAIAYPIDAKADDGKPQSGWVMALMPQENFTVAWAGGGSYDPDWGQWDGGMSELTLAPIISGGTIPAAANDNSCYDNGGVAGRIPSYSTGWKNGSMPNCSLAFQLQ